MNVRAPAAEAAALAALTAAVYAATALGVAAFGEGDTLPFWPALAAAVLPFGIVRALGALDLNERALRVVGATASLLLFYVVGRAYLGVDAALWQLGWLIDLVSDPTATLAGHAAHVTALMLLGGAWLYGAARASREAAFEGLMGEASAGLAIVFVAAALGPAADAPAALRWLPLAYVAFALLALALEQLPAIEPGRGPSFLRAWAAWVVGGLTVALGLALLATFIDPPSLDRVGDGLAGVGRGAGLAIAVLLSPVFIALAWVMEFAVGWLGGVEPFVPEEPAVDELTDEEEERGRTAWGRVFGYVARSSVVVLLIVLALAILWFAFGRLRRRRTDEADTREDVERDVAPLGGLRALVSSTLERLGSAARRRHWSDAIGRLYFAVLQRAEEDGLARPPSSTPLEFSPALEAHFRSPLPGAITRAYAEARYGGRPIAPERVTELRAAWRELTRAGSGH